MPPGLWSRGLSDRDRPDGAGSPTGSDAWGESRASKVRNVSSNDRPVDAYLNRWQEAGLLDAETATRIREFEAGAEPEAEKDRPGVIEAGVYLGLAVIAVGVVVLVATNWQHLRPWARISVSGIPALLALLCGQAMRLPAAPGIRRGGMLAWVLALALVTSTAAIVADEGGWSGENILLTAGIVALCSSVALWVFMPSEAQLLGLTGSIGLFSVAMSGRAETDNGALAAGVCIAAFGAAGVLVAELGFLVPRTFARVLSSLGVVAGGFFAGIPPAPGPGEAIAFVGGACLIVVSIRRGVFVYTGMGVASLFIGLVTLILRHVDNTTAAAVALIAVGAGLLACVLLLERFRPWVRTGVAA